MRRRDQLDPEIGHWTTHEFYLQAAAQLAPQLLRIAVLCSPARLSVYEVDPTQQQFLAFGLAAERPYQLRLFIDEGQAIAWVKEPA
ncbi:hypothetical protein MUN84_07705 [Hymenobacter sp. 5516J-16]|uniref:hypothetical protein n=1 Tax=Hymenobacter sp. 5516J-16 TaxID=2932253 RepID=UPI001FD2F4C1|nr:hypothetical protein [Hymenobacter sp. 5516J-16]UOQ78445.1 hypothetical protein MUN84_07705 [Hymenobacter sp. 5516J-16]